MVSQVPGSGTALTTRRAAWLVPCWEFVVDTGAAPLGEDCDQTLHQYESFCVPAVELAAVEGYGG